MSAAEHQPTRAARAQSPEAASDTENTTQSLVSQAVRIDGLHSGSWGSALALAFCASVQPLDEPKSRTQQWAEMAAIVNSSDDAILSLQLDGTITSWNAGAQQMYGFLPQEAVGNSVRLIVPAEFEAELAEMLHQLQLGEHLKNIETQRQDKQGRRLAVSLTLSPIQDASGRTIAIAAIERDISARKLAEAQLQALNETLEQRIADRTGALNLLYDVTSAANMAESVDEAMRFVLRRVSQHSGWSYAHAYLPTKKPNRQFYSSDLRYEADPGRLHNFQVASSTQPLQPGLGLPGRVLESGLPEWIIDAREERRERPFLFAGEPAIATAAAFPVLVGERVVAVLEFVSEHCLHPGGNILESMASIGMQLGRVVERKELERQIAHATVREQRRIGQELHDSVAQQLTGISMMAETLRQRLEAEQTVPPESVGLLVEHIKDAQGQVRRLSRGLMPVEVDARGLMSALSEMAGTYQKMHEVNCTFECDQPVTLQDNATSTHLYRIAQEAMQNVLKHANARHATIRLAADHHHVRLSVEDDGVGMPASSCQVAGIGQRIMRYRAGVIGASLKVHSPPSGGTTVICTLKQNAKQEIVS